MPSSRSFAGECTCVFALEVAICSLVPARTCGLYFDQLLHHGPGPAQLAKTLWCTSLAFSASARSATQSLAWLLSASKADGHNCCKQFFSCHVTQRIACSTDSKSLEMAACRPHFSLAQLCPQMISLAHPAESPLCVGFGNPILEGECFHIPKPWLGVSAFIASSWWSEPREQRCATCSTAPDGDVSAMASTSPVPRGASHVPTVAPSTHSFRCATVWNPLYDVLSWRRGTCGEQWKADVQDAQQLWNPMPLFLHDSVWFAEVQLQATGKDRRATCAAAPDGDVSASQSAVWKKVTTVR